MKETVYETVKKTREVSKELRPAVIENSRVGEVLEWLVCECRRKFSYPITFSKPNGDYRFSNNKTLALYRIVQEAFTNCVRYAEATEVRIHVETLEKHVDVWVCDNGNGFDFKSKKLQDSFGLVGMQERARQFGGNVEITSIIGDGTKVHVLMPKE